MDHNALKRYPNEPGVYLMKDRHGTILYVGKAKKLRQRISQYFQSKHDGRKMVPYLTEKVTSIDFIVTPSEKEALLLENTLIKKHYPRYNALLKDDKSFICLKINHKHRWPRLSMVRSKEKFKNDGLYFGPYPNAFAARKTLELLSSLFPLRQCSDKELTSRTRPCILHAIGKCIAPCVNRCTKNEYDQVVQQMVDLLKGQDSSVIDTLNIQMEKASAAMEYEKAGEIHKKIQHLTYLQKNRKALVHAKIQDCDALALLQKGDSALIVKLLFRAGRLTGSNHYFFDHYPGSSEDLFETFLMQHYTHHTSQQILLPHSLPSLVDIEELLGIKIVVPRIGEKKKLLEMAAKNATAIFEQKKNDTESREELLERMQRTLNLSRFPLHIECFDTSSIAARDFVGAHVTFIDGQYAKAQKRLYKIQDSHIQGDVPALEEILTRRLEKAKLEDLFPDLIIVDGGKAQLNAATAIIKKLGIAVCDCVAVAKEESLHTKGMTQELIFLPGKKEPLILKRTDPLLLFIQKIRDTVHQAAITYFRQREKKRVIKSALDPLQGIGPIKKKRLLTHFKSIEGIKNATDEAILSIPGITKANLRTLRESL